MLLCKINFSEAPARYAAAHADAADAVYGGTVCLGAHEVFSLCSLVFFWGGGWG